MTAKTDAIINRDNMAASQLPDQIISDLIQDIPSKSVVMSNARNVRLSRKKATQSVLSALPEAYWVNGDTGLKQTTEAAWKDVTITAEELAVIVPIPDALIDDTDVPLWEEIKPLLAEAIGKKVDEAALFGTNKPSTWGQAIVPGATAASNTVAAGTGVDLADDVAIIGEKMAAQGYSPNGFVAAPGLKWELRRLRDTTGQPVYSPSLVAGQPGALYGINVDEMDNGAWNAANKLIAIDWTKFVIGIRQDITYKLFEEGVITDEDGKVVLNLMQQDCKALRVVFRVGYQTAMPYNRITGESGAHFPAGVVTAA